MRRDFRPLGRVRVTGVLVVLNLGSVACAVDGEQSALRVTRTDSSGVEMVRYGAPVTIDAAVLSAPAEEGRIGASESDTLTQLGFVTDAQFVSGGRIGVLDARPPSIRLFSPNGRLDDRLAVAGSGPGELESAQVLGRSNDGDTLFVFDGGVVDAFGPDGHVAAATMSMETAAQRGLRAIDVLDVVDPRAVLFRGTPSDFTTPPSGAFRVPAVFGLISATGAITTIPPVPDRSLFMAEVDGFQRALGPPFAPRTYAAAGGSPLRLVVVDGADGIVRIFRPDGTLERSVDTNLVGVAPSEDATDAWESQTRARWARSMSDETVNRLFSELPRPSALPLVTGLHVTSENRLWLKTSEGREGNTVYLIYGMTGDLVGAALLPTGFDVFDVRGPRVLGRLRDAMDVQNVVVLRAEIVPITG